MLIKMNLNGKDIEALIEPDMLLIDFLRSQGCLSVKRGCDTSNCGLCTVFADEKPILSCSVLTARMAGHKIVTLEGMQQEAKCLAEFIADQGAEQCGFCSPGLMMQVLAMKKEKQDWDLEEIKYWLSGNLCRCTGYMGQMRAIQAYLKNGSDQA